MQVIVKVSPDAARSLHGQQPPTSASEELIRTAKEAGAALHPMHPGATDSYLAPYFYIEVPDRETADRVVADLGHSPATQAAYWKPEGSPP